MFSICIPNYNYERYLGLALESIFRQSSDTFEVLIADNCSTDNSVGIIEDYAVKYPGKVRYKVNPVNKGFSANLDEAASMATGKHMIMLSSDDIIKPDALSSYEKLIQYFGADKKVIICSSIDIISASGEVTGSQTPADFRFGLWDKKYIDEELTRFMGVEVYRVQPSILLKSSLLNCTNPFNFLATCYSSSLYHATGGYTSSRLINPDKWFHWRLLEKAEEVVFINKKLFQYRWHGQNQTAQQLNTGYLKYMVDEYRNTMEVTSEMLAHANIARDEFVKAFIDKDIIHHGLGEFSRGRWLKSLRIFFFGLSAYPGKLILNKYFIVYLFALLSTPVTAWIISKLRK